VRAAFENLNIHFDLFARWANRYLLPFTGLCCPSESGQRTAFRQTQTPVTFSFKATSTHHHKQMTLGLTSQTTARVSVHCHFTVL
jgi:hypothetical protein